MPTPPKATAPGSTSSGPSIRLTVGGGGAGSRSSTPPVPSSSAPRSNSPSPTKKRRFEAPTSLKPNTAQSQQLRLLHQKSHLSVVLSQTPTLSWHAEGVSTLYVLDESNAVTNTTANAPLSLALHLRGSCQVTSVDVEGAVGGMSPLELTKLPQTTFQHLDPLERVLLKPASSFTMDDVIAKEKRHEADSQSSRGAVGMTNALRAASIASQLGELRMATIYPAAPKHTPSQPSLMECWKQDLATPLVSGSQRLDEQVEARQGQRRTKRIDWLATTLADAKQKALKITVKYHILLGSVELNGGIAHLGGIHACTTNQTPHMYTTAGVYGDHEGPRSWMPTLDSASTKHRASQQLSITVTAPSNEGISVVGFGEDIGATETLLHDRLVADNSTSGIGTTELASEFGASHVAMLERVMNSTSSLMESDGMTSEEPHIIPPDSSVTTMNSILATTMWRSASWLPIPARSLGFAVGPFRILEDPEYFAPIDVGDTSPEATELRESLETARENGEGIRQAYLCPIFARKLIHATTASTQLLPNTRIELSRLTIRQKELLEGLDRSVISATVGVPNRALSLMRDILAVPAFRTVSYTQIWIPHAVHGGNTSGALHCCPEVLVNPFLGGSIMDSRLLPPVGHRLPYHQGGRVLQFIQARCAIRGWITSAIPLGGQDDVGQGYIHALIESLMMNLYERGHGAHGEGGAQGGAYFVKRFASGSGLNSSNLDFLPVQNIEDMDFDVVVGSVIGAVPVEDRNNDQLWRSASNGTESHTSAMDEMSLRQLLVSDSINVLDRGNDKDRFVPTPSMGWMGSHLSLSFLSSNANSSSDLGCGALELVHPTGGLVYRALKTEVVRRVVSGRAGISNFIRLVRAAFIAAHLDDMGQTELKYPPERKAKPGAEKPKANDKEPEKEEIERIKPRFIVCVNELLKKKGLTHTLFVRALQNLAGRVREAQLMGTLVDAERDSRDPRTNRPFVDPEGFPNSYVRGASELYLRVGVHVEPAKDTGSGVTKGIQLQSYAEPVIPEGGIAFGGPVTVRVVENEGQFREFVKDINVDGSRRDWGSLTLHAKPVTLPKTQTAASGIIESTSAVKETKGDSTSADSSKAVSGLGAATSRGAFSESSIHRSGYQAIELIRLTNLTPLLWVRVDPMGLFSGRISVFQPDACLAEMLFHDGDAGAQVESLRALAERPLRIQGSVKVTSVYDVKVSELPVRVLADCLRGSAALHSSLPHTPAVRAQAALAIAQWQNNKAPSTKNTLSANHWVGINLLVQYFRERFYNNSTVMPVKFNRVVLKKNDMEVNQAAPSADGAGPVTVKSEDEAYSYLDSFEEGAEREIVLEEADEVEVEEDEEYRVRSAVITAIASVRAKDGMTPASAIQFLETILDAVDAEMVGNLVSPDEDIFLEKRRRMASSEEKNGDEDEEVEDLNDGVISSMPHVSSMLVADALLALCHVNMSPTLITDPTTGKPVQSSASHPVSTLMGICRRWLEWELYREGIRAEIESESLSGVTGVCYETIAACAITALSSLAILRQSTTDRPLEPTKEAGGMEYESDAASEAKSKREKLDEVSTAPFYMKIFDHKPLRSDVTRAACAQAITCICCATDRFESESQKPIGLLVSMEFVLERIVDPSTSPGLRQTLAQLMLDACTGKICSMQRVGTIGGRNDLVTSAARFFNGPLGATHGGDNGGVAVTTVNPVSYPAANAVNDGARRGLRLLSRAGHPRESGVGEALIVRIAKFASNLWRTINGEPITLSESVPAQFNGSVGICASDGHLRCTLLALWQWCWPRGCFAVMQVQTWKSHEGTQHYTSIGADMVMKISSEEKEASNAEEASLAEIGRLVSVEIDRQLWRGEMFSKSYEFYKGGGKTGNLPDAAAVEQGIGQPLPPIQRDSAFKAGGWIASAAQQRRALALDGGTAVTKLRLRKSGD